MTRKILLTGVLLLLALPAWGRCSLNDFVWDTNPHDLGAAVVAGLFSSFSSTTFSFAEASGTSGCDEKSAAIVEQLNLVANVPARLADDLARGDGEHLTALAALMGCPAAARPALGARLQVRLGGWVPGAQAHDAQAQGREAIALLTAIHGQVGADPALAAACPVVL